MISLLRSRIIQPKLTVSHPDDEYEREADCVADQVTHTAERVAAQLVRFGSSSVIRRKCACISEAGDCGQCKEKNDSILERTACSQEQTKHVPGIVDKVLRSPGRPLDRETRNYMEPRFNYDFGHVRVHDGMAADRSAQAVNAKAYTVGHHIVFAARHFQPASSDGRQLIAHELAHVVQQSQTSRSRATELVSKKSTPPSIQRACGPKPIASALKSSTAPACVGLSGDISDVTPRHLFRFRVNCDEFASTTEAKKFADFLKTIRPGDFFKVHGFASVDGDMNFNMDLSCARARKAAQMITKAGGEVTDVISFGPTEGVAADRRSVVITRTMIPIESPRVCPKGIKKVDVSIFLLPGATRNAFADLAFANRVFADCCVQFNSVKGASLGVPGWANKTLHHIDHCGGLSAEEEEMFQAARASGSGAKLWIFYVENYDPDTVGSKGISCSSALVSGKRALFPPGAYIKNAADASTLAHEFGHLLILTGDHHGIVDKDDPSNLMKIQSPRGQNIGLDSKQCDLIFAHA